MFIFISSEGLCQGLLGFLFLKSSALLKKLHRIETCVRYIILPELCCFCSVRGGNGQTQTQAKDHLLLPPSSDDDTVYDMSDPDFDERISTDPEGWVLDALSLPDVRVVVVDSPSARSCLSPQAAPGSSRSLTTNCSFLFQFSPLEANLDFNPTLFIHTNP